MACANPSLGSASSRCQPVDKRTAKPKSVANTTDDEQGFKATAPSRTTLTPPNAARTTRFHNETSRKHITEGLKNIAREGPNQSLIHVITLPSFNASESQRHIHPSHGRCSSIPVLVSSEAPPRFHYQLERLGYDSQDIRQALVERRAGQECIWQLRAQQSTGKRVKHNPTSIICTC